MVAIGINIINYGAAATRSQIADSIRWAEGEGFDLAMTSDHVAISRDVDDAYPAPFREAFTTMAWAAGFTTTISLGITVAVIPYRHPLQVALMTETMDELSDGRFVVGIGSGWARQEFAALGVAFTSRGTLTDEYLAALIAQRDGIDFAGANVQFSGISSGRFRAPIWVGGNGPIAIRRAISFGQAWHPLDLTLTGITDAWQPVREKLGPDAPDLAPRVRMRPGRSAVSDGVRRIGEGTWDQIETDMRRLVALGARSVVLDVDDPTDPEAQRGTLLAARRLLTEA